MWALEKGFVDGEVSIISSDRKSIIVTGLDVVERELVALKAVAESDDDDLIQERIDILEEVRGVLVVASTCDPYAVEDVPYRKGC